MISFNVPPFLGTELEYVEQAVHSRKISGDGQFTARCSEFLRSQTGSQGTLLTTSCSSALEMAAVLCNIEPGDEVIMPSFTFVSTANAFVMRGAVIKFVDIRPDTKNIDETLIEQAITERTKAIAPVHYAGIGCEMDAICDIARRHSLFVVEDAAQAVGSLYKGKPLGTFGDYGCLSFHETKNLSMGEGGALLIRDSRNTDRAEIIREKGTDRTRFLRGQVDKYTWVDIGSSYLPSEINAAYLLAQLERCDDIKADRKRSWNYYRERLVCLEKAGAARLPVVPETCEHNAHMFYIVTSGLDERTRLIEHLKKRGICAVFHYVPLHSSPAGKKFGRLVSEDRYTTRTCESLVRLPMYYGLTADDIERVCEAVLEFYSVVQA